MRLQNYAVPLEGDFIKPHSLVAGLIGAGRGPENPVSYTHLAATAALSAVFTETTWSDISSLTFMSFLLADNGFFLILGKKQQLYSGIFRSGLMNF